MSAHIYTYTYKKKNRKKKLKERRKKRKEENSSHHKGWLIRHFFSIKSLFPLTIFYKIELVERKWKWVRSIYIYSIPILFKITCKAFLLSKVIGRLNKCWLVCSRLSFNFETLIIVKERPRNILVWGQICTNGSGYRQWSHETKGIDTNIWRSVNEERKRSRNCIAV